MSNPELFNILSKVLSKSLSDFSILAPFLRAVSDASSCLFAASAGFFLSAAVVSSVFFLEAASASDEVFFLFAASSSSSVGVLLCDKSALSDLDSSNSFICFLATSS